MSGRPQVVVIGGGFGGLTAVRRLAHQGADVTLVDRRNYHTFQPLLYQVATAGLDTSSIAYPLRGVIHRQPSVRFRLGEVVGVDLAARQVVLADGAALTYDQLVLAAGAVTADFGVPGVEEHGLPLKTLTDAMRLRNHLLSVFEDADAHPGAEEGALTIVVAGGGPTGVELCGGIFELVENVLDKDHPQLPMNRVKIIIVEGTDRLLGGFAPASSHRARRALEKRGIDIRLHTLVQRVAADHVELSGGEVIPTRTLVWTAGIKANPLAVSLRVPLDRSGRVPVEADLSLPGHPEVWVVGDLAAAHDPGGGLYPQLAPVAMQQARHVARQMLRRRNGQATEAFHYLNKGTMATIGRNSAVAELPGHLRLGGFPAWLAWLGLHLVFLIGFRNRLSVLLDWSWNYLTYQRGARLILPVESDDDTAPDDTAPDDTAPDDTAPDDTAPTGTDPVAGVGQSAAEAAAARSAATAS
jgi:NADH dehydrogenase